MEAGKEPAHVDSALAPAKGVDTARISFRNYCGIGMQLALVLVLLRQYQIEGTAFVRLSTLAFAGFAIHALLPLRYRLLFFCGIEHYGDSYGPGGGQ